MQIIENYDFSFLHERYVDEHPKYTDRFDEAVEELRKFLTLPLLCDGPLAAMSHGVDELWHTFIAHTPQYADFCDRVYGEYLHHQPRSLSIPVPVEAISNFYREYPKHFGAVPPIWLEDISLAHIAAVVRAEVPAEVQQLKWSGWPGRK